MASNDTRVVSILPDAGGGYRLALTSGHVEMDVDLFPTCCDNPKCECRDLHITMKASHSTSWAEPYDEVSASVDVDSGKLVRMTEGCTDQLRQSLVKQLEDGALLLVLRERWRRIKLHGDPEAWRKQDWSWWEPGLLIAWHDAFPGDFDETVFVDDELHIVRDMYCSSPRCPREDVVLDFLPARRDKTKPPSLGPILVDLSKWKALDEKGGRLNATQTAFWGALADVSGIRDLLRQRKRRMQEVGRDLNRQWRDSHSFVQQVASRKIGRNAPCPCGSGKKFKRCCGAS